MSEPHLKVDHNLGSRLLLYTGLGLLSLVVLLVITTLPQIPPQTIIVDNGKLWICDNHAPPDRILDQLGRSLGKLDTVTEIPHPNNTSDKLFIVNRAKMITIVDADRQWTEFTTEKTVGDLIRKESEKFSLSKLDRVNPPLNTPLRDKMEIQISRITFKDETKIEKISPDYKIITDSELPRGKTVTVNAGKPGTKEITYRKFYVNGKLTQTQKVKERIIDKPETGVKKVGSRVITISRSGYRGKRVLEMEATAYDAGPLSTGKSADGITATGVKAKFGIVAVDPKVIPLGTKLFIEGYGYAIAADTGGAIKGLRIDLFFESRKEALKFGRRKVKVYILE